MTCFNQDQDPFETVAVGEDGRLIFGQVIPPGAGGEGEGEGRGQGDPVKERITVEKLKRWYSSEKMHRHIVKILGWVGRKKGYQSLQIDPSDEDFEAACEVLHRRIASSSFAFLLRYLGDEAIEDIIICFVGFSPVLTGYVAETVEKGEAKRRAAMPEKPEQKPEGKSENE